MHVGGGGGGGGRDVFHDERIFGFKEDGRREGIVLLKLDASCKIKLTVLQNSFKMLASLVRISKQLNML